MGKSYEKFIRQLLLQYVVIYIAIFCFLSAIIMPRVHSYFATILFVKNILQNSHNILLCMQNMYAIYAQ